MNGMLSRAFLGAIAAIALLLSPSLVAKNNGLKAEGLMLTKEEIQPSHVLQKVEILRSELDLIRLAVGKSEKVSADLYVVNASPREVYFIAEALYQKSNQLAYEVTSSYIKMPKISTDNLNPKEVLALVDASLERIILVKKSLKINKPIELVKINQKATPADVFNAILKTNEELNTLLYKTTAPSEVYQQVTLAVNYTANILKGLKISPQIPMESPFIENKKPKDVFNRLIECITLLQSIATAEDVKMLEIKLTEKQNKIMPSDVFDLAKIIVSEVRYLDKKINNINKIESYYPGYKTPSQVYQRASILLKQLKILKKEIRENKKGRNLKEQK